MQYATGNGMIGKMVRAGSRMGVTGLLLLVAFATQAQTTVTNTATVQPPTGGTLINSDHFNVADTSAG